MSALAHSYSTSPYPIAPVRQDRPIHHIDIAPTRAQRRARPRVFYAIVTVSGLLAILVAQLLLSIVLSEGAYQISSLQKQQRELSSDEQLLTEQLQVLESPQHLAANAENLGMVSNSSTAYLRLSDGAILGTAIPAKASDGIVHGPDGASLVPNSLLGTVDGTPTDGQSANPAGQPATAGAPHPAPAVSSVASTPEGLPSPVTR